MSISITPHGLRRLAFAALAAMTLAACQDDAASAAATVDRGDFVVRPAVLETGEYTALARQLSEERWLEDIADVLNESLNLPVDIGMRFAECGENNA